jgi:RecB family exonuclease
MTEELEWVPHRFELAFGLKGRGYDGDEHSQDDPVELVGGLRLRGAIDLVEKHRDGRLRVTDYKTGRASVAQGAVIKGGEALQPVFYALAAEVLFPEAQIDGGRLYYCTTRGGFQATNVPLDYLAKRYGEEVVAIVAGRLQKADLPAAPAPGACRWCDYRAVCGPDEEFRTSRKDPARLRDLIQLRDKA